MRSEAAFRALLRLYPRKFREEFGGDVLQLVGDMRNHGGKGALAVWARVLPDVLLSAIYERKEWLMDMKTGIRLAAGALLGAGVYTALMVGMDATPGRALLVFGIVFAIVAGAFGLAALIGRKLNAPTEEALPRRRHWWVPAPIIIAFGLMLIGVRPIPGGLNADHLITLSLCLVFAGLLVFGLIYRAKKPGNVGNWAIMVGCLPALGVFWFPVVPLIGLVGIIGSLSEVLSSKNRTGLNPA